MKPVMGVETATPCRPRGRQQLVGPSGPTKASALAGVDGEG